MKRVLFALAVMTFSVLSSADSNMDGIAVNADAIRPLLIGQHIPDVNIVSVAAKSQSLRSLVGKKPSVIVFFRGGWCPFCNLQLKDLKDSLGELNKLGFQLLAISSDKPEELKLTQKSHALSYELYSDSSAAAAKAFGIAFHVNDQTVTQYKGFNIDLEQASGNKNHVLPVPSVFIVSSDGEIQFEYVNPNYKVRLHKEILLAAAKVFSGMRR